MVRKKRKDWKAVGGYLLSAAVFGIVLVVFVQGMSLFAAKAGREGADTLRQAVTRASVQCYAIEGRYPPSVAYLEENYGVQIDRSRYTVFYNGFASNIMPEITIQEIPEE